MNRTLSLALATTAVAAALAAGYWAGGRGNGHEDHAPTGATGGERKVLYYRNPMGLPDTSPVPKKDSMGMDYIPVYAGDEPAESGVVKVSPARMQTLGVRTATAEPRTLDDPVRAVGRVEVNERAVHAVSPRFEGWIEHLHVSATGDPVRRGQPLFSVYSPELVSVQRELAIAETLARDAGEGDPGARAGADRLAAAARARLRNWDVQAPAAGSERLTFSSPVTGVVLEKNAVEGARFMAGETIFRIADLSRLWIVADVYERDLARVAVGQRAVVTVEAFPERRFEARVSYLYPTLDTAARVTPVRLEIGNPDGLLRPGMFAHVDLAGGDERPRLAVPASAVIDSGNRQVVLQALGEGRFKPREVKIGRRGREHVEIREGLEAGERVVVSANFLIDAESNLRAALATLGEPPAEAAPRYEADGTLDAVDASGTATITHAEIPALQWPEMTMEFELASPEVAAGIAPGTPMRFEFEQRAPGEFVVTRIEPLRKPGGHRGH